MSRNDFQCMNCGLEANSDHNAVKNIRIRYAR
ncbi:hypothetical protein G9463_23390 [Haloarcula sp. JP-Z28]|uniref:Transposase n=2 Tax=Haloarcula marismortui TaxID=2238 RepID=A0A4P8JS52_HALMA|nr:MULTISPECIES: zinc ribbon domain-containing protein [Haloarcula]NHN66148.1 hypothetical protein [Haloarcula sp. JP-Z28]QCP89658.1 hypothetical protein E6P14_01740 [Haloarcula marismortui ATCC 43049]QUJ74824.1 hypothetical protein KDQ40_22245 [Haloarcula sinaiiensis ATCC 33800]